MEDAPNNLFSLEDYREPDYRRVRRINDVKLPLGSMAVEELDGVIGQCQGRVARAHTELQIAQDYRDHRFPEPTPDDAA